MKKFLAVFLALYIFVPASFGQSDEIRPAAIGVSFFLNDFETASRIRSTSLQRVLRDKQWADTKDMAPGMAVTYFKGVGKHVDFAGTLAGSFLRYPMTNRSFSSDRFLLEGDASVNLKMVSEKYWVQPYLIAGIGGSLYAGKYFGAFLPTGLGFKVNFFDDAHLFVTSQYRIPVTKEVTNYHFFYQLGIAGRVGKKKEPELKPLPPPPPPPPPPPVEPADSDKDGILDTDDKCPQTPGLARYQGCPIPDTDKDGINDEEDKCPTQAGPAANQGCPFVDSDGDGIADPDDKCPNLFGTPENQGCPEVKAEVVKTINYAANNIYFATGKYTLLARSFKGLDEVVKVMKDDAQLQMSIEGHTDNVGSDASNQKLSENRAASVKAYLVKKGVDESRIKSAGFGETTPVADNKTAAGRQQNRRVELKLSYF